MRLAENTGLKKSPSGHHRTSPAPPLNTLTIICIPVGDYVKDTYHTTKFYSDWISGFASMHAQLCAPLFTWLVFLGVLEITNSQDATTDFDAKYVKRLRKEVPFGGRKTKI